MLALARAIEARGPSQIATRWRGKRLVVTGTTKSGGERVVYLELKVHGQMDDFEVRSKVSRTWPNLPKAVMYEGIVSAGPERLKLWLSECRAQGQWSGAPGKVSGAVNLPRM